MQGGVSAGWEGVQGGRECREGVSAGRSECREGECREGVSAGRGECREGECREG